MTSLEWARALQGSRSIDRSSRSPWTDVLVYGIAVVSTCVTVQLRLFLEPVIHDAALTIFIVPIGLSAYLGGVGPGLVATALSGLAAAYFLLPPKHDFAVERPFDFLLLAILIVAGTLVSLMSGRLRRDRSRAKESEDALRESEERLQTVVENLSEGLVVSDAEGDLLHWNRAGLEMHGFRTVDEGRRHLYKFRQLFELTTLDGTVVPYDEWPLPRILRGEQLRDLDLRIRRLDIDWERTFSYGGTIVREPGGRQLAVLTITDITRRKQLEAQLRQTQKMESIGRLAGGVAHDFNNWLTVITGCSELLEGSLPPDPQANELIGEIKHATDRAAALTRQLLAFSRREVLEPRIVDLNTVVGDAEKMLRRILGEDVLLMTKLDPTISRVRIDAGQWVQVLMNLAVNARDAMPKGGRLTIETKEVLFDERYVKVCPGARPGRYVALTVNDTGHGMSADIKARVFEPFFTTKRVGEGTGLGLSVVHGIVEQSEGHIAIDSEYGVGTTFCIYLPRVDAKPEVVAGAEAHGSIRGTETILLVEDDESVRRITSRALQHFGYTVLQASNGAEALLLLEQHHAAVSLLITDVVMPHMDGRELAETVLTRYPGIRVIYSSGYTEDAVVRHGVFHAEVAFLQKPHTLLMLLGKVREVLDGTGSPTQAVVPQ